MRPSTRLAALGLALAACGDPLLDARIAALGDEDPRVEPSEWHRPGQPCTWCHGGYVGAEPDMSVAGTLYFPSSGGGKVPVAAHVVRILDSEGQSRDLRSNCAGNFFVARADWDPAFPLRAEILRPEAGGGLTSVRVMTTRISREGSCAGCHSDPADALSPGVVYVPGDAADFPAPGPECPWQP